MTDNTTAMGSKAQKPFWRFGNLSSELFLPLVVLLVVIMLVVPLPAAVLDVLLSINISFSIILLMSTIYLTRIMDLSTFPTVLLLSTVFRLAITISTTRAILAHGDAGNIIFGFGNFVVAGNLVVGIVVFAIIAITQFIVVTKGAERVAEVGARFSLDAMPGKQISIEADLRGGDLTRDQARDKRLLLEKENQFYGAMDGAMRFVKGDAIASMVVVFVNLIAGLIIGMAQRGMSFSEAGKFYTILSVGDGLVAQIPSMLSAISAGIIVTRVMSDESKPLGKDIAQQLSLNTRATMIAGCALFLIGLVPGFPTLLTTAMAFLLFLPLLLQQRFSRLWLGKFNEQVLRRPARIANDFVDAGAMVKLPDENLLPRAKFNDSFVVKCNANTAERLLELKIVPELEKEIGVSASRIGIALPMLSFRIDGSLPDGDMVFLSEDIVADKLLLPMRGTEKSEQDGPALAKSLARLIEINFAKIFSADDAEQWLEAVKTRFGRSVIDLQKQVSPQILAVIVRGLLSEDVPLSHPRAVFETILGAKPTEKNIQQLIELCRLALATHICTAFSLPDGRLVAHRLGEKYHAMLGELAKGASTTEDFLSFEKQLNEFFGAVLHLKDKFDDPKHVPLILTTPEARSSVSALLRNKGIYFHVMSLSEASRSAKFEVVGDV
jgi:type III secretion protein V